jgi:hypothetical protein
MARPARLLFALLVAIAPALAGADDKSDCVDAHAEAQLLRRSGRIGAARARLVACSVASCPALVARDCTQWLSELDAEQPTVVLAAHDETGRDVAAVRVTIDGQPLATQLDGRPLDVDPGRHVVRGEFSGGRSVEITVVVRATEKDRVIRLDLPAAPPPSVPPPQAEAPRAGPPVVTYVLAGVGALALGSFAYFGLSGKFEESHLASTCRPNCAEDDIRGVRRSYLAADVSLGVALVAIGVATWFALQSPRPAR